MSKKTAAPDPSTTLSVPFKSIYVPPSQIRSDEPLVLEMAESLEQKGQLYPVLVSAGGPDGYAYTLHEGFRRMAAWALNKWQNREILVSVRPKGDALSRIADNWTANTEREGFAPLDQAECVARLLSGTYPVLEGEEAKPIAKDDVATLLGMTPAQVGRLARLHKMIDPDVARLARKANAPLHLLTEISRAEGETEDERVDRQAKLLTDWQRRQEALEASGRKRSQRSDKGKKKGKKAAAEEPQGALRANKRVTHAAYADEKERAYSVDDYLAVLKAKHAALEIERAREAKEQAIRVRGILDGIRFMTGEITRLPDLSKADFEVLKPVADEAEKVAE